MFFVPAEPATHLLQVADELATKTGVLGVPTCVARSPPSCNTLVATLQVAKSLKGKLIALKTNQCLPLLLPNFQRTITNNVKHSRGGAQITKEKCLCQESCVSVSKVGGKIECHGSARQQRGKFRQSFQNARDSHGKAQRRKGTEGTSSWRLCASA